MQGEPDERAVLKSFFKATNGQQWSNNDGWGTERPLSEWYGVIVEEVHVVGLDICGNNLEGSIPVELGQLSSLKELILFGNQLSG
ncbi:unnamed protein product, partial [Chrysoparadoxa australica]